MVTLKSETFARKEQGRLDLDRNPRPMDHDAIRKALEPYLSNLDIIRDDVGGCTITPYRIEFQDDRWDEINDAIKKLDGSWVKATKFTRGYWRILRT
ncbi:MAG: hypothetical protein ABSD41_06560 [Candidatus Bathyarchaeia archaeon]|jgi:hypothetical protein